VSKNDSVVVLGAGGHAKVVISTLHAAGYDIVAVLDDDATKHGSEIMGVKIVGTLMEADSLGYQCGIIAVGENATRKKISERVKNLEWLTVVHPKAYVDPSVRLGEGTVVFAGAVIQAATVAGRHVIINTGATVDHDCVLGDFVHVAPGSHLAGEVEIGEGALLGLSSGAIPGICVGAWAIVGAGGIVVDDVPERATVIGIPARTK
jgi:sugar O-acyltransferase (sialic acid O-acetyltransferase NeuD family)